MTTSNLERTSQSEGQAFSLASPILTWAKRSDKSNSVGGFQFAPKSRSSCRRQQGQSLVELAAGLMIFVPIILLLADCAIISIGVATNDAACRDAARAASSGPPGLMLSGANRTVAAGQAPYKRAQSVIKDVYNVGGLVKIESAVSIKETVVDPLPEAPRGGPIRGEVSVETTAQVAPPFLVGAIVGHGTIEFKNTQKYPYTYIVPATPGG